MKNVIAFPGRRAAPPDGLMTHGESSSRALLTTDPGKRAIPTREGNFIYDSALSGSREQVMNPTHPACWFHGVIGPIHASEVQAYDQIFEWARAFLQFMEAHLEPQGIQVPHYGGGFFRNLIQHLMACYRRGELLPGYEEQVWDRFVNPLAPTELVQALRERVATTLQFPAYVKSAEVIPLHQEIPAANASPRRMPSILEVLDHFMPRVPEE